MLLTDFLTDLINKVIQFLPQDPFINILASVQPSGTWLNYLNWVVPVGAILDVTMAWLGAIAVWYVWQAVARWLHMVG